MDNKCPSEACPIHNRIDGERIEENDVFIVTYVGDYAVTTIVSPELRDPMVGMAQMIGMIEFPPLLTAVGYVGQDSIEDSKSSVPNEEYIRFFQRHFDVEGISDAHKMIVDGVRDGILDLSTPVGEYEMQNEAEQYLKGLF